MSALANQAVTILPAAALVGAAVVLQPNYLPFAVAGAATWTGYRIYTGASGLTGAAPRKAVSEAKSTASKVANAVNRNTLGVVNPDVFQEFTLTEKKQTSHNTAIYRFGLPKSTDVLGLPIGQHISLAAHVEGEEKEVVRSYTPISSDDRDKGYFDLMIKSYPTGRISKHMGTLKEGDTMRVKGPKGAMKYEQNMCRHIGMIAGGTGITPMLQIVKAISRGRSAGDKTVVDLIFANVNQDDILLREDLDELAESDADFRVHYVLNNPPPGWTGGVGFVTPEMIKTNMPAPADDIKILVCGPPPMVKAMQKAVTEIGYEKPRTISKLQDQIFCF
ncbi:MAG: hypothetical protein Q9162_002888 [Coniocarpon cinnabarinum]